jgi:hypothetical protein
MTDRELLERAALASGYAIHSNDERAPGAYVVIDGHVRHWNPLTDDGDALRLAVKLRMAMDIGEYGLVAFCGQGLDREIAEEQIDGDPYAATRRSIVRAAAAMAPTQTGD